MSWGRSGSNGCECAVEAPMVHWALAGRGPNFVQFSWLGAWARCAPWAARVSAEGLNRRPLAKLRRCNCAVQQQRKPSRVPWALEGGTDALLATLRHPPNAPHGLRTAFKCSDWQVSSRVEGACWEGVPGARGGRLPPGQGGG